jgi:hypothetical protein
MYRSKAIKKYGGSAPRDTSGQILATIELLEEIALTAPTKEFLPDLMILQLPIQILPKSGTLQKTKY